MTPILGPWQSTPPNRPAGGGGCREPPGFYGNIRFSDKKSTGRKTMTEQQINDALEELRREIEKLDIGDQETKERLADLVESIEQRMTPGVVDEDQPDLIVEMNEAVTQFEVEHPRITGILNDIMMALSSSGI